MNIERNDERILIKYVDANFNTFKCVIPKDDVFVVNFCKGNLEKMEKILQKYVLQEMFDHYILTVEEPVCLEYKLKKEQQEDEDKMSIVLSKFKDLERENHILRDTIIDLKKEIMDIRQETSNEIEKIFMDLKSVIGKTATIEERIGDGVFLPGYSFGIIPENCESLSLSIGWSKYCDTFTGNSLKPLSQLKNLKSIKFNGTFQKNILDDLKYCENLSELQFERYCSFSAEFTKNMKNLKKITFFANFTESENYSLSALTECKSLEEVNFKACDEHFSKFMPQFGPNVRVIKN